MGLFSKLFGKKSSSIDLPKEEHRENASKWEHIPPYQLYEMLVDSIVRDEDSKSSLKTKLQQAFDNPSAFYDEQQEFILSDRGLTFPKHEKLTPKFVLIDTLLEHGLMAEIDWKEDEDEIRFAIKSIVTAQNYNFSLSEVLVYDEHETDEILELINNNELKPFGFSLEILDIDSDSYVFTITTLDKQTELSTIFDKLK